MEKTAYEIQKVAKMDIVLLDQHNFSRESLNDFSREQVVKNVYRLTDGALHLVYHPFTETWTPERKDKKAQEILAGKHIVYGAFKDGRLVGILMLLPTLDHGRMRIDSFHVSAERRRHGIGRALFEAAKAEAVRHGADALYVSACSSEETINFYRAMGFAVSSRPIRFCVEDEPWDIQMECRIPQQQAVRREDV